MVTFLRSLLSCVLYNVTYVTYTSQVAVIVYCRKLRNTCFEGIPQWHNVCTKFCENWSPCWNVDKGHTHTKPTYWNHMPTFSVKGSRLEMHKPKRQIGLYLCNKYKLFKASFQEKVLRCRWLFYECMQNLVMKYIIWYLTWLFD